MTQITVVVWEDAVSHEAASADAPKKGKAELCTLQEAGFLLDENENAVQIGMEIHDDHDLSAGRWRLSMPMKSIKARYSMPLEDFIRICEGKRPKRRKKKDGTQS